MLGTLVVWLFVVKVNRCLRYFAEREDWRTPGQVYALDGCPSSLWRLSLPLRFRIHCHANGDFSFFLSEFSSGRRLWALLFHFES